MKTRYYWIAICLLASLCICLLTANLNKSRRLTESERIIAEMVAEEVGDTPDTVCLFREDSLVAMATAFAIVETKCQNLTSDCGKYVGYLQMSTPLVDFVNDELGRKVFSYEDRGDWQCCLVMFSVIMDVKNPDLDIDTAVDIWNKHCPKTYRRQVKIYYEFLLMNSLNLLCSEG